ncbi:dTMP kinase [Candidatus Poriferisodalis sp.]|uniref:dTMP kinase n=1 Tax=Candidatus Poriferisodalis sp. TaxID=3101277 RepID=UPI003B0194D7
MTDRGRYIALEGWEGSGKTTQAALLAERLEAVLSREPGATPLGEHLREVLLGADYWPSPRAEALLFAADRAQHIAEVVSGHLAQGRDVVTDRSYGSTLAYQGYGRGLPLEELRALIEYASGRPDPPSAGHELPEVILPDVVVLLDVPLAHRRTLQRQKSKQAKRKDDIDGIQMTLLGAGESHTALQGDKFEDADSLFRERVWHGFRDLCAAEPERWVLVDGTGRRPEVAERVREAVAGKLAGDA